VVAAQGVEHAGHRSAAGQQAVWGTVTRWEPPAAVAFTWHPGYEAERASQVEVTFTAAGAQTLVRLTHTGWEIFDDPAAARAEYDQGWPAVLGSYVERTASPGEDDGAQTWVALLHRPARPPRGMDRSSTIRGSPTTSRS
jgi:Activator of Hsp90 ATPase homolog 1-like protein